MLTRSLSILVLSVAYLLSQTQSRLDGIVSDSTGAVIAGATVVARNVATGVAYSAKTNESGSYTIPFLPPAEYELTGEVAGFKKNVRRGAPLETGSTQTLNLRMEVCAVTGTGATPPAARLPETAKTALRP